jgi:hypothetical protein
VAGSISNGRSAAPRTLADEFSETLNELVTVRSGSKTMQITRRRAIIQALIAAATDGDVRAATAVLSLEARLVGANDTGPVTADEDLIIEQALMRRRGSSDD